MKILVCCKYVRDEAAIAVNPDRTLDMSAASWELSQYDSVALEAGMRLAAAAGDSQVEALSAGGEAVENSKMRKAVLSRGPAKLYTVRTEADGDILSAAKLLAQAYERIGGADLVICGDGSGDMYSQVLGTVLAAELGVSALNCVSALELDGGRIVATRMASGRAERYELETPAVVSVTSDICRARIPSMKDILGAGKKPVEGWSGADFETAAPAVATVSTLAPEKAERLKKVYAPDEDGLEQFVRALSDSIKGVM